ncbi:MAG TPA: ABC transporter ATP-binding protein [Stellaceae bacterium]|nr:ABC transporter ATP-binding protein [Stellaceae bacterium]
MPEPMPDGAAPPVLEARGIVKRFGALAANDGIDLAIAPGEVHALLGENGAGKSTLVKILYGALKADAGEIAWFGRPTEVPSPAAARALGIGMVFQHFSLFDALTVAENVALAASGREPLRAIARRIARVSADYGLPLDPARRVHELSVGERQRIEIVRCLLQDPKLLILDEPTSVLTPQEADLLFETLERLARGGRAILYITHRLEEVRRLCDRATVLRHGRVVATVEPREETAAGLARLMVGADVKPIEHRMIAPGRTRLELRHLSLPPDPQSGVPLHDICLGVQAGEVVAIAGVAGNGQNELFAALSGETLAAREAVWLDGAAVGDRGITERRRHGAAFVPEERLGHAAVPGLTLSGNVVLSRHATGGVCRYGFVLRRRAEALAAAICRGFDVRAGGRDPEASSLSGGNLQKFVVGREILAAPGVLVVNQPTWGVDVGAAVAIRQALVDLAARGAAVLVISQDLDEIFAIADRIAVIAHGRLSEARPARMLSLEHAGLLMGGAHPEQVAETADAV